MLKIDLLGHFNVTPPVHDINSTCIGNNPVIVIRDTSVTEW